MENSKTQTRARALVRMNDAFEDELAKDDNYQVDASLETADEELLRAVLNCGLDAKTFARLQGALSGFVVQRRRCDGKARAWREEAAGLEGVLDHLMQSRAELDEHVEQLMLDVEALPDEIQSARVLGENIDEECQLIQGELERLTQVLFEEVNAMVSTEARAKHEELVSAMELEKEIARVKDNLAAMSRRFNALKARLNSSGKLVKQLSEPRINSAGRRGKSVSHRSLVGSGSSKALDDILRSALSETDDGK
jgi:chromosome segregation ATPase